MHAASWAAEGSLPGSRARTVAARRWLQLRAVASCPVHRADGGGMALHGKVVVGMRRLGYAAN